MVRRFFGIAGTSDGTRTGSTRPDFAMRSQRIDTRLFILLGALALPQCVLSAPAAPRTFTLTQPDGSTFIAINRGDEWNNRVETTHGYTVKRDRGGVWRYVEEFVDDTPIIGNLPADGPPPARVKRQLRPQRAPLAAAPQESTNELELAAPAGSFTGPVLFILASFSDTVGTTTEAQWGTFVTASIGDYFSKTSHGRAGLIPATESFGAANNGVVGWVNLGYAHPNTGDSTGTANQTLTRDAILAADPYVNFAAYDQNGDGYVDSHELAIVVVAAGYERSYSSTYTPNVWGHKWSLTSPAVVDGKTVGAYHYGGGGYAQFGELHRGSSTDQHQATMGIMVHELGHLIFGLPDLYDTDGSSSGVGNFCLMSGGSWGKAATDSWLGQSPVLASAWVRYNRGWVDDLEANGTVSLTAAGATTAAGSNTVVRASTNLATEYFLLENRQPQGYDRGLQGLIGSAFGGLAIWHVDTTQSGNTNDARRLADLEEADASAMGTGRGQPTDLWYAGNAVTFNDSSNPNSTLNPGGASGVSINAISASNTVMTASFGATTYPDFVVTVVSLNPTQPTANGTMTATVTVKNQGIAAAGAGSVDVWTNQASAPACGAAGTARQTVGTLAAGASTTLTFSGLPAGTAGTKTLLAFIDSACATTESNEGNNQITAPYTVAAVQKPDFTVTAIKISPTQPAANGTFTATVTLKNRGTGAGSPGQLDVWANPTSLPGCGAVGDQSKSVGTLAAGSSATVTFSGLSSGAKGTKIFRAFVDSACQTAESNETNNQLSKSYTVK
ncbi:M6 family metalloprotease domain-containing protein [uncultured Lamprocystis sp.]|jgi:M6 family metalloprotease-like protein|uniref:M6 family metalloprotease domain-containing protein n=1 Tax=uncultured Lamprocystis sp. TaxID=543132 RepID=UPI0025D892E4|nr:M6 family metalloprotease domain-containing protein [uncultured Lamprocystis sp.]